MLPGPVLGGRLSLIGPLLGAALIRPVDLLGGWLGSGADALCLVPYGSVLVGGYLLLPRGFAAYLEAWHRRLLAGSAL